MSGFTVVNNIPAIVGALGALGTASAGLVDACKALPSGGVSNFGFGFIESAVQRFYTGETRKTAKGDVQILLDTLHAKYVGGVALADQKAGAKELIKGRLTPATAESFAKATHVHGAALKEAVQKCAKGTTLDPDDSAAMSRFDLELTAILDACYQHADQRYRNAAKMSAMIASILLALFAGWAISDAASYWFTEYMWQSLLCGLLATPLAPVTKDLTSALNAGVQVAQALKPANPAGKVQ